MLYNNSVNNTNEFACYALESYRSACLIIAWNLGPLHSGPPWTFPYTLSTCLPYCYATALTVLDRWQPADTSPSYRSVTVHAAAERQLSVHIFTDGFAWSSIAASVSRERAAKRLTFSWYLHLVNCAVTFTVCLISLFLMLRIFKLCSIDFTLGWVTL